MNHYIMLAKEKLQEFKAVLEERLAIIANHTLRDADPATHLEQLKAVSYRIDRLSAEILPTAPPDLKHFLKDQSYNKALACLEHYGL